MQIFAVCFNISQSLIVVKLYIINYVLLSQIYIGISMIFLVVSREHKKICFEYLMVQRFSLNGIDFRGFC